MAKSTALIPLMVAMIAAPVAMATAGPDQEGHFAKRGLPCFADICVGDAIEDLSEIPLLPAPPPIAFYTHTGTVEKLRAKHEQLFQFWDEAVIKTSQMGVFDHSFLPIASKFAAFCPQDAGTGAVWSEGFWKLKGQYVTDTGLKTTVVAQLLPDTSRDEWPARYIVTEITREIPVSDGSEAERLTSAFQERYAAFSWAPGNDPRAQGLGDHAGYAHIFAVGGMARATLAKRLIPGSGRSADLKRVRFDQLAKHPRCASVAMPALD